MQVVDVHCRQQAGVGAGACLKGMEEFEDETHGRGRGIVEGGNAIAIVHRESLMVMVGVRGVDAIWH